MEISKIMLIGYCFFVQISICNSEIYRSTDKSGTIRFSDQPSINSNVEKVNILEPNVLKKEKIDSKVINNLDELNSKLEEMNREAESCSYYATSQKKLDISCQNFRTLMEKDFLPLLQKMKEHIEKNPMSVETKEEFNKKINLLKDMAERADRNYIGALRYLIFLHKLKSE